MIGIGDTRVKNTTTLNGAVRVYSGDAAGEITQTANTTDAGTDRQCYSYDHLDELTQAWTPSGSSCATAPSTSALGGLAPYWQSYTYDQATGNPLTVTAHGVAGAADTTAISTYAAAGAAGPHAVTGITTTTGASSSTAQHGV